MSSILSSDIILIKFIYLSRFFSAQKTIERYRTYTKDNVSNKTVQQDIEVTWLYFLLSISIECRFYQEIVSILWIYIP
jgi:hypothetical protein